MSAMWPKTVLKSLCTWFCSLSWYIPATRAVLVARTPIRTLLPTSRGFNFASESSLATHSPTWRKGREHPSDISPCHTYDTWHGMTMQRAPDCSRNARLLLKLSTRGPKLDWILENGSFMWKVESLQTTNGGQTPNLVPHQTSFSKKMRVENADTPPMTPTVFGWLRRWFEDWWHIGLWALLDSGESPLSSVVCNRTEDTCGVEHGFGFLRARKQVLSFAIKPRRAGGL